MPKLLLCLLALLPALVLVVACGSSPTTLELGQVQVDACGPRQSAVSLKNDGTSTVHFTARIEPAEVGAVSPSEGDLESGVTRTLSIFVGANVTAPATATLVVNAGDTELRGKIDLGAPGASVHPSLAKLDFGDEAVGAVTSFVDVEIANDGTTTAEVAAILEGDFIGSWAGGGSAATIPAGERRTLRIRFAPSSEGSMTGRARFVVNGIACNGQAIDLGGRGVTSVLTVVPSSLDWGLVDCRSKPSTNKLTVTNTSKSPVDFQLAFDPTSRFKVTPSFGTIAPGATIEATVTIFGFDQDTLTAPEQYATDLLLTSSDLGAPLRRIRNHVTARGIRIDIYQIPSLDFGRVKVGESMNWSTFVYNSGNVTAHLKPLASMGRIDVSASPTVAIPAPGNAQLVVQATAHEDRLGYSDDSIYAKPAEPVCNAFNSYIGSATLRAYDRAVSVRASSNGQYLAILNGQGKVYRIDAGSSSFAPFAQAYGAVRTDAGGVCAIAVGGSVVCDGTITNGITFANATIGGWTNVNKLVAGRAHVCALDAYGVLSCLGANDKGQLGNGTFVASTVPVVPSGGLSWFSNALDAHDDVTCGIANGKAYCWGDAGTTQRFGPAGNGPQSSVPIVLGDYLEVHVDGTWIVARDYGGAAWWWGTGGSLSGTPQMLSNTVSSFTSSCMWSGQTISCFGDGIGGRLGDGAFGQHFSMVPVDVTWNQALIGQTNTPIATFGLTLDQRIVRWGAYTNTGYLNGFD